MNDCSPPPRLLMLLLAAALVLGAPAESSTSGSIVISSVTFTTGRSPKPTRGPRQLPEPVEHEYTSNMR